MRLTELKTSIDSFGDEQAADRSVALKGHGFSHATERMGMIAALAAEEMLIVQNTFPQGLRPKFLLSRRAARLKPRPFKATIFAGPGPISPVLIQALQACSYLLALAAALSISAAAQAPPTPAARFAVVLDAAHGGNDPGGLLKDQAGANQPEKTFTLALSVRLRSLLAARGISVVTTRESDATVDPDRRSEIANHANAQACLSLHTTQSGSGIHLFVSSLTPAEPARFTPWKTAQAAWVTRSLALAGVLNSALLHAGMTVTLGRSALPVVDSMTCPAVAVEIAPEVTSSQAQPTGPGDSGYQARVAQALAAAILQWRSVGSRTDASHAEVLLP